MQNFLIRVLINAVALWAAWAGGVRDPWAILALVALSGLLAGVNIPSWQSFVNDLVPREDLLSAVTLNSLQFNAARALGRALAAARDPLAPRVRPLAWGCTAALAGTLASNAFYLTMQFYYFYAFAVLVLALPIVFGRAEAR